MRAKYLGVLFLVVAMACCSEPGGVIPVGSDRIRDGWVDTNGTRLYFKTLGTGDPIVVLHGGPGFDHRQFLPFIWDLASKHQVILFDQRGTGLSSGPVDSTSITLENFVADIEGIRQAFGIDRMNLFGHSWGGRLAMHYALRHPDHLRSLILASTAATSEASRAMRAEITERRTPENQVLIDSIAQSEPFLAQEPHAITRFWQVYFQPYFVDPGRAETMDLTFPANTIQYSNTVAGLILRSEGAFDLHEELGTLEIPTLVLHGDSDPMPLSYAERLHEALPSSEIAVLERSGHWIFVDAMDQVTEKVVEFLDRVGEDAHAR